MSLSTKVRYRPLRFVSTSVLLLLATLFIPGYLLMQPAAGSSYSLKPTCSDSLQQQIDAATPGSTIDVRTDCVYRERVDITKPLTLNGQGRAEIRGSDVWSEWTQVGSTWVSTNTVRSFFSHGSCSSAEGDRCLWPEQVFMDGASLHQVAAGTTPAPGQFSLNNDRQVVVVDDPTDSTVEVTTRYGWIVVTGNDVTIKGFTMQHSGTVAQVGGIEIVSASGVTVENNNLSHSHSGLVSFTDSTDGLLRGNDMYNAGQQAFKVTESSDITIENNLIHHNNVEGFAWGWEGGAFKIQESSRVIFDNNDVYNNNGPGYWCDWYCSDVVVSNNRIYNNIAVGIFFEASFGAEIFNNQVWENGWGTSARYWAYESGILIASSSGAHVYDNVVAHNGDGIGVISQCRNYTTADPSICNTSHALNRVSDNFIHNNSIIAVNDPIAPYNKYSLAWLRDLDDESGGAFNYMFTPEANNRGADNKYWVEGAAGIHYSWGNVAYTRTQLPQFNATPGEENGVLIDDTERDAILTSSQIPLAPEDHTSQRGYYLALATDYSSPMPVVGATPPNPGQETPEPNPNPSPKPKPSPTPTKPRPNPTVRLTAPQSVWYAPTGSIGQPDETASDAATDISSPEITIEPEPEVAVITPDGNNAIPSEPSDDLPDSTIWSFIFGGLTLLTLGAGLLIYRRLRQDSP